MTTNRNPKKKLIEVALPLDAINSGCLQEKNPFLKKHPRSLHLWWARRPLAAARAVIFAQMVDDPSAHTDLFPTEKAQEKERQRLFRIIEDLVLWENTNNENVLQQARNEIWQSWRYTCAENADHPRAKELFDRHKLPAFHDPFAGGGALPLEAQRLGMESYASELNPVAVLINKAMIEIPPKFAGKPPVNPESQKKKTLFQKTWHGAEGLAEDVRFYGKWLRDRAEKRIGHLYPKVEITAEMTATRPDLKYYVGKKLTVIAWLWARTVKSPNPAFSHVDVPLISNFTLSTKKGKEAYVKPVIEDSEYRFTVKVGKPKDVEAVNNGTKLARANFRCILSDSVIEAKYIRTEAQAGRMGARMMAIVAEGERCRIYLQPSEEMEAIARSALPAWKPDLKVTTPCHDVDRLPMYGMPTWGDAFTSRQLVALTTFSDLVQEAREQAKNDAIAAGLPDDRTPLAAGGNSATAYADAVGVYLGCGINQLSRYSCSFCGWNKTNGNVAQVFGRQAIQMVWDYAEANPLEGPLSINVTIGWTSSAIDGSFAHKLGHVAYVDAQKQSITADKVVSTDPPYYDNIGYAELSDFFYVWLRRSMKPIFPDLFATLAVPKAEELVATPHRHGSKEKAEAFFLDGMTQAMHRLADQSHPAFPVTIYYAFKQSEMKGDAGTASTGWETFLDAVIRANFSVTGTWPMRTERDRGLKSGTNTLASSIILVCRLRTVDALISTRGEFIAALNAELPEALKHLQRGNIAPVDLAQASIGPGMAVYSRYAKVLDAEGKPLSVRDALVLINQTLDEALAEQESDFDHDSRWALAWFGDHSFEKGPFGDAHTYFLRFNTAENALKSAGIIESGGGDVRLLKPSELPADWDPETDKRLTAWEGVHQLIRALESGGEGAAAALVAKLGSKAETARELAYRLYTLCERKKRAAEALSYNSLVQSWPEISRLARESGRPRATQTTMFDENEE